MADIMSVLSSGYLSASNSVSASKSKYVNVKAEDFEGNWSGKYANGKSFEISVSQVNGFRAKVKYQSSGTVAYQDVLIRDNAFKIGDSKFTLVRSGTAQIKTVMDSANGSRSLETAYAKQN